MAGFSYADKKNGYLFEVSMSLDSQFPPAMNFNVTPWEGSSYNRQKQVWCKVNISDFYALYQNLMEPATYPPVEIKFGREGSGGGSIGIQNGIFYANNGNSCYGVEMDVATITALANYIMEWHLHAGVYKDLCETIKTSVCKCVQVMIMDVAKQLNMNIQQPKMYEPTTKTSGNSYTRKTSSAPQFGTPRAAAPSMPRPQAPVFNAPQPQMPQVPQMNNMAMPQMGAAPIPKIPQMNSAPQMAQAPSVPMPAMNGGIPMGVPIPQTPRAADNVNAQIGNMLNTTFGQIPQQQ